MFVSCFKSSRAWPRVYPHHHLYFQILRNVTNYSEQITSSRSEIYEFQTRLCRVTKVDCSDEILPVPVSEGYKTHSTGNKKLSQFSPMSSLLLPHCSPMKISAVVMNCCQCRPDLPDDVCLIIWPNAIGIQILPPPPAGCLRIIEMLSNWSPAIPQSNIFKHNHPRPGLTQHHSSLYCSAQSEPNIGNTSNSQITQIMFPILMRGSEPALSIL